jgi:hypothetical protein
MRAIQNDMQRGAVMNELASLVLVILFAIGVSIAALFVRIFFEKQID